MKTHIFVIIIFLLVICSSCHNKESVTIIDLTEHADSICLLSDIAESIEYYPIHQKGLEKKCNIEMLTDYVWVNHRSDSVKGILFSRPNGTMVNETVFGTAFQKDGVVLNDETSTYFRLQNEKTLVCPVSKIKGVKRFWFSVSLDTQTGEMVDTIAYPYDNGVEYFRLDDHYVLRKHRIIGDDILPCFKLDWHTATLDFIKQDVFPETVFQTYLSWNQTKVHLLKDKIYFHMPTMKTIYEIGPNHAPIPLYQYKVGKYEHKYKDINDVVEYWKKESMGLLSCYAIRTSLLAENYIFGGFNYKGKIHWVLFNRNTHQKVIIPTSSTIDHHCLEGIKNDLDGGFDFWPRKVSKNGEIYTWYNVDELKDKVNQCNPEQMKNPEAAQRLKELLKNLPEDVNVIVAVLKEKEL